MLTRRAIVARVTKKARVPRERQAGRFPPRHGGTLMPAAPSQAVFPLVFPMFSGAICAPLESFFLLALAAVIAWIGYHLLRDEDSPTPENREEVPKKE